jgi:hypothetical protein
VGKEDFSRQVVRKTIKSSRDRYGKKNSILWENPWKFRSRGKTGSVLIVINPFLGGSHGFNPSKYIPAYGGWCAYGMATEKKFPIDPDYFKVVDNRLFLFLKNKDVDALELWNKEDEGEFTWKADRY